MLRAMRRARVINVFWSSPIARLSLWAVPLLTARSNVTDSQCARTLHYPREAKLKRIVDGRRPEGLRCTTASRRRAAVHGRL
jgi:hypothetical protein